MLLFLSVVVDPAPRIPRKCEVGWKIEQEKVEDIEQEKAADNFNSQALTISSAIIAFVSIIFWIGVMRTKKKIYD